MGRASRGKERPHAVGRQPPPRRATEPGALAPVGLDDERLACLFGVAFAISAIFESVEDAIALRVQARSLAQAATTLAALAVLARPGSAGRLLVLAAAFAAALVIRLPLVPNHGFVELGMCATLGVAALVAWQRGERLTAGSLLRLAAPPIRLSLLVMYGWAVVQKLNRDFFDPAVSCGPVQIDEMRRYLWWLLPDTPALRWFGIYGTLVVETAIPILLCSRARHLGIALALGFHWVLGAGYARFSAMLIAPLVLFIDPALLRGAAEAWGRRISAITGRRLATGVALTGAAAYLVLAAAHAGGPMPRLALHVLTLTWLVYGALAAVVFGLLVWRSGRIVTPQRPDLHVARWPLVITPLALLLSGFAPHLGLKSTQAFAMYSNLRTEDGATNHFLFPAHLQIFPFMSDLVTIVESSDPVLARLTRRQWPGHTYFFAYVAGNKHLPPADAPRWTLPFLALRRRVTDLALEGRRGVRLVYERGGVRYERRQAERDPGLAGASWLERKLLLLRAVPMTDRGYCMW